MGNGCRRKNNRYFYEIEKRTLIFIVRKKNKQLCIVMSKSGSRRAYEFRFFTQVFLPAALLNETMRDFIYEMCHKWCDNNKKAAISQKAFLEELVKIWD